MTFFDLESNFFEKLSSRASFWGIICPLLAMSEIWPHIPPNAPGWPQGFLSSYKKIFWQNWVFWRLIEKKIIMSWITLDFLKNKTNVLLRGVIFQFRGQISKKVAGHFEEHKKLGRQPNFQNFLATGGLVIPRRRLIGGCYI